MQSFAHSPLNLANDDTATLSINRPITLYVGTDAADGDRWIPFTATAAQLALTGSAETGLESCQLVIEISPEQYQQVMDQGLFHLKPEVRGPLQTTDFSPDWPVLLELGLESQLLTAVETTESTSSAAIAPSAILTNHLLTLLEMSAVDSDPIADERLAFLLAAAQPASELPTTVVPWLQADRWRCRSVQQHQADTTVGYTTLWSYTTPEQVEPVLTSGTEALAAIAALFEKTTGAVKAEIEPELPQLKQSLSQVSDHLVAALEQVDWEAVMSRQADPAAHVSAIAKQFFDDDDWAYVQIPNSEVLQLAFQGDAGRWTCLAQCDDAADQVVFYSICPVTAPADRYGAVSELLMRANDGLIVGNFELSYGTGEIRYKTSLDVEGDRLTPALMERLVYINVQTLDTYLPGILAVLDNRHTPAEAIALIEHADTDAPP